MRRIRIIHHGFVLILTILVACAGIASSALPSAANQTVLPTPPPPQPNATIAPGAGLIAYSGQDGNIWLANADGSDQRQITKDGTLQYGVPIYHHARFSHDGTMLAFSGGFIDRGTSGIWLLRDGTLTLFSNTEPCVNPVFAPDDSRIFYSCINGSQTGGEPPDDLATNPLLAMVASSKIDGSDQRSEVTYAVLGSSGGSGVEWIGGRGFVYARISDIATDGTMLVMLSTRFGNRFGLYAPDGTNQGIVSEFGLQNAGAVGPSDAVFLPGGKQIVAGWCISGCARGAQGPSVHGVAVFDLDGTVVAQWNGSLGDGFPSGVALDPTGSTVVVGQRTATSDSIYTLSLINEDGARVDIGAGVFPTWQPVAVAITLPNPDQPVANTGFQLDASGELPQQGGIVFSAQQNGQWDIFRHDFASGTTSNLTNTPDVSETAPAISHNGAGIAFLSDKGGSVQIWTMESSGQQPTQRTLWYGAPITEIRWSANDARLFLTLTDAQQGSQVFSMSANGGRISPLLPAPSDGPEASSDGSMIVYSRDGQIVAQNLQANAVGTPVAQTETPLGIAGTEPRLASTAPTIVYVTSVDGVHQVAAFDVTTGKTYLLPNSGLVESSPAIAPDGSFVAWIVGEGPESQVWVASTADGRGHYATPDLGTFEALGIIVWAP